MVDINRMEKRDTFLKACWLEMEPVLKHGIVAAFIALTSSGLILLFDKILPIAYAADLHKIDHFLVLSLFWLFSGHTLLLLLIRLFRHLRMEIKGDKSQSGQSIVQAPPQLAQS